MLCCSVVKFWTISWLVAISGVHLFGIIVFCGFGFLYPLINGGLCYCAVTIFAGV